MRINARLDEEDSAKIRLLTNKTGMTLSELVKNALRLFYESQAGQLIDSAGVIEKSGFIGCAKAGKELSRDYKKILHASLEKKHGHR